MRRFPVLLVAVLLSGTAHAIGLLTAAPPLPTAPEDPPVTDLEDGGTFTLAGTIWGTNVPAANQVYECDALEGQTNGTELTATILGGEPTWSLPGEDAHIISTAATYNCGRSILTSSANGFQFGFQRNIATTYDAIYVEGHWLLDVNGDTDGQLKLVRLGVAAYGVTGGGIDDSNSPSVFWQNFPPNYPCNLTVFNSSSQDSGNTNFDDGGEYMVQEAQWTRVQMALTPGTAGTANGIAKVRSTRTDTNAVICDDTRTGRIFRASGDAEFARITWQNYQGNTWNAAGMSTTLDGAFYAIYNTTDSTPPKFVWACNKSTWSAVNADSDAVCVVQVFTSWSNTSISGTFNQGRLSGLTPGVDLWFYVLEDINDPINTAGAVPTTANFEAVNDPYAFTEMERAA